jgi:hypothetical protein
MQGLVWLGMALRFGRVRGGARTGWLVSRGFDSV